MAHDRPVHKVLNKKIVVLCFVFAALAGTSFSLALLMYVVGLFGPSLLALVFGGLLTYVGIVFYNIMEDLSKKWFKPAVHPDDDVVE